MLAIFAGLSGAAHAQTGDVMDSSKLEMGSDGAKKVSPTKRASRQLMVLQEKLNLSAEQVQQVNMILITRASAMDSVKASSTGNRRGNFKAARKIQQDADQQINDLLTDDQKKLYQQWKDTQKEQRRNKRGQGGFSGSN